MSLDTPLNGAPDWTELGPLAEITDDEERRLEALERTVEHGMYTFIEVGNALAEIRNGRLYRADFPSFEAYCIDRWGLSRGRAGHLIQAAEVVSTMVDSGLPPPENERQARAWAAVPAKDRPEVAADLEASGKPITGKAIEEHPKHPKAAAAPVVAEQECSDCHRSFPAHALYGGRCDDCRIKAESGAPVADDDRCHMCGAVDKPGTCGGICVDCAEKGEEKSEEKSEAKPASKPKLPSERAWEPAKALGKGLRLMLTAREVMELLPSDSVEEFDRLADEAIAWGKRWKEERKAAQRLRLMGVK